MRTTRSKQTVLGIVVTLITGFISTSALSQGICTQYQPVNSNETITPISLEKTDDKMLFVVGSWSDDQSTEGGTLPYYGKFAKNGTPMFQMRIGELDGTFGELHSATEADGDDMIVVGYINHDAGSTDLCLSEDSDIYIAKVDDAGSIVWQQKVNLGCNDYAYDIVKAEDDTYWVLCEVRTNPSPTYGKEGMYVLNIDENGALLPGAHLITSDGYDHIQPRRILQAKNDDLVILAVEEPSQGAPYIKASTTQGFGDKTLLFKFDPYQPQPWIVAKEITHPGGNISPTDMVEMGNRDIVITGTQRNNSAGLRDKGFVCRLNSSLAIIKDDIFFHISTDRLNPSTTETDTRPEAILRKGGTLYLAGASRPDASTNKTFMMSLNGSLIPQEVGKFEGDGAVGSMKHTGTAAYTKVFLTGPESPRGLFTANKNVTLGGANCCEVEWAHTRDHDVATVATYTDYEDPYYPQRANDDVPTPTTDVDINEIDDCPTHAPIFTGIESMDSGTEGMISVYPNPTQGAFTLSLPKDETQVTIINATGQTVYEETLQRGDHALSLSSYSRGLYTILVSNDQVRTVHKLVLQ